MQINESWECLLGALRVRGVDPNGNFALWLEHRDTFLFDFNAIHFANTISYADTEATIDVLTGFFICFFHPPSRQLVDHLPARLDISVLEQRRKPSAYCCESCRPFSIWKRVMGPFSHVVSASWPCCVVGEEKALKGRVEESLADCVLGNLNRSQSVIYQQSTARGQVPRRNLLALLRPTLPIP